MPIYQQPLVQMAWYSLPDIYNGPSYVRGPLTCIPPCQHPLTQTTLWVVSNSLTWSIIPLAADEARVPLAFKNKSCCSLLYNYHLHKASCIHSQKIIIVGLVDCWCSLIEEACRESHRIQCEYPVTTTSQLYAILFLLCVALGSEGGGTG